MPEPVRVLMTVASLDPAAGGPTVAVLKLSEHLLRLGCEVAVATRMPSGGRPAIHEAVGVDPAFEIVNLGPSRGVGALAAALPGSPHRRALRSVLRRRAQLVHDHGIWLPANLASALEARAAGLPWIAQPRGMLEAYSLGHHRGRKRLAWTAYQRRALRGARRLVATSSDEKASIERVLPGCAVEVIPNGVDWPERLERSAAPQRQAVFLSRIHPKKQPLLLVDCWAALRPAGWKLVIAGPGEPDHVEAVRRRIAELGAGDRIELRGPVYGPAKARLLGESHLFVLPTHSENFGNVVAEAMAHGLPVLTTTGTPWLEIERLGLGWRVTPEAGPVREALAQAVALDAPELLAKGERARHWVRQLSWQAAAARLADLYRHVLAES